MTKYLPINKVLPVWIAYCIVTIVGMYHHELWFDEVQHWLLARDTRTIGELFTSKTYDDHLPLWKYCLFILSHYVTDNPFAIQVLHLIVINVAVFIFLRYAPFNLIAKILILSGYYFIFEYSILCRNYALGILFLFIACTLLAEPGKNMIRIGFLILLMNVTHMFFVFASAGIFLYVLYYSYEHKSFNNRFFVFVFLSLGGFIIALSQFLNIPDDNTNFYLGDTPWLTIHNVSFAIHGIDKGFIPFPPLHDPNFWNRHLFETWSSFIKVPISLLFLTFPVWVIRKNPKALIFYTISSLLVLLFLTKYQMAGARYYGMFFIFFIVSIWLADFDGVNELYINKEKSKPIINIVAIGLFYVILFTQVLAGIYIYAQDYVRPFSQAKSTVRYIHDQKLAESTIVIDGYNSGPALSAYLRHQIYYLDIDTIGSYCSSKKALNPSSRKSLIQEMQESKHLRTLNEFILISNRSDCDSEMRNITGFSLSKLYAFQGAIIPVENYCIYKVAKK